MTQHTESKPKFSFYPSRFFISSPKAPDTESRIPVVLIDGRERNNLIVEYRVKTLEGKFQNLVSSDLDTCPLRQRWGKKCRWTVTPYTIVDCSKYERTIQGVRAMIQFELRLLMGERVQDDIINFRRSENLPIVNQKFDVIRSAECKSGVGSELVPTGIADPAVMFRHVVYSGRKLCEWYDIAESDQHIMGFLKSVLDVRVLPDGRLDRSFVPAFNYSRVLCPPTHAQLEKWDAILPPPSGPEFALPLRNTPPPPIAPAASPTKPANAKGYIFDDMEAENIPF